MPSNSLAPGFVKLFVQSPTAEHVHTIPVKPYLGIGGVWFLEQKGSSVGSTWDVGVNALVTVLKPFLSAANSYTYAELWTQESPTIDPVFRDSIILGVAGTNAAAYTPTLQYTFSLRTEGGGVGKVVVLDASGTPNIRTKPPYTGITLALANYLVGNSSIVVGRDNTWHIAMVKSVTKLNDALRRKYNLS